MEISSILQCRFLLIAVCAAAGPTDPTDFLARFGYLGKDKLANIVSNGEGKDRLANAVRLYQEFNGLHVTGNLTRETLWTMEQPRCGNKDIMDNDGEQNEHVFNITINGTTHRQKRYALNRNGAHDYRGNLIFAPGSVVTYSVDYLPSADSGGRQDALSDTAVVSVIDRAFAIWREHTNLQFQRTTSGGAIGIGFFSRSHLNDGESFDGRSGVLAHAFFPRYGADVHFDNDEYFTDNTYSGVNLLVVAVHEIGHSLGLDHSRDRTSIMYARYRGYEPNLRLKTDDIMGIQALYGVRQGQSPSPVPAPAPSPLPAPAPSPAPSPDTNQFCNRIVDAAVSNEFDSFLFIGGTILKLNGVGVETTYSLSQKIRGLTAVDAAVFSTVEKLVYLFRGSQVYSVGSYNFPNSFVRGPENIRSKFPQGSGNQPMPTDMTKAVTYQENNRNYFFKGNLYWRISNIATNKAIDAGYPQPISKWQIPGLERATAAIKYDVNSRNYFFYPGNSYVRLSMGLGVDSGYPRSIGSAWLNC